MRLRERISAYGQAELGQADPKVTLEWLYTESGWKLWEIAQEFGVTRPAVANLCKSLGVELAKPGRRSAIEDQAKELGYDSLRDYFLEQASLSFEAMAEELSVSVATVQRHYDKQMNEAIPA